MATDGGRPRADTRSPLVARPPGMGHGWDAARAGMGASGYEGVLPTRRLGASWTASLGWRAWRPRIGRRAALPARRDDRRSLVLGVFDDLPSDKSALLAQALRHRCIAAAGRQTLQRNGLSHAWRPRLGPAVRTEWRRG